MIQLLGKAALAATGLVGKIAENTPVVGKVHTWTQERAAVSDTARKILVWIIIFSTTVIVWVLYQAFKIIMAGKLDAVTGTFLGGVFTFFGLVLTSTIPAFVNALIATTTTPPADAVVPKPGDPNADVP